jgi:hypothetical protein
MSESGLRALEHGLGALEARMGAMEYRLSRYEDSVASALSTINQKLDAIEAVLNEARGRREAGASLLRNLQWLWGAVGGGAVVAWLLQPMRR